MSQKFRAKFQLQEITSHFNSKDQHTLTFRAVYDDGIPENQRFNQYTPWGEIKMIVTNPEVKPETGQYFYVDFTPAQ